MHVIRRGLCAVLLALPALPAGAQTAGESYVHASGQLSMVDNGRPERRRVVFKAGWPASATATMEDPRIAGATLRLTAAAGGGDTGAITLPFVRWRGLGHPAGKNGYRYDDPSRSEGGIRSVLARLGRHRGTIKVIGGGASWPYVITGLADGFTVTFAIGDTRWCSDFRTPLAKSTSRRVLAKSGASFTSTFEAIQDVIFNKHGCTQAVCHGAAAQGGLDLQPDVAFQNLVGVFSPAGQMDRVKPGDEEQSFLWRKLAKGTLGLADVPGAAMPNGLPPIPAEQLDALKIWIRAGAPATGVVGGTEGLLSSCFPNADPIHIPPPDPPAPQDGAQLHAPAWPIAPRDEDEVCFATYFDFSAQIPLEAQTPCPDFWGGPTKSCFFYNKSELTQDPNSHHSLIHIYKGVYDITDPAANFGPFTCHGGATDGQACNPLGIGLPAPGGADCGAGSGCAGKVVSSVACIGYGPPDYGFDLSGLGSDSSPLIGGSQAPVSSNVYPPGVFSMIPVKGVVVWNSHAFNLTFEPTTNQQWLNLYFAGPTDRTYPVQAIFDARDIFVQNVPPFEKREYCRTHTLPQGARLFQLSSHTHKRGKLFRIWGPGIAQNCSSSTDPTCTPEPGPPIFTTTQYNDPTVLYFDPPVPLDSVDAASRRYKFCSLYDNGATNPDEVKRQSTSPNPPPPIPPGVAGGPCNDTAVACMAGPHKGQLCHGDDRECDSTSGAADGVCDACPLLGGVTTEDEMFILLGLYYVVP